MIPVHNALHYLKRCLESLEEHTAEYRLILIDDASDEETADFLRRYSESSGAVLQVNQSQQWFTRTVNRGLRLCENDWVALLNSDLELSARWLEGLYKAALGQERVGVVGCCQVSPEGGGLHSGFVQGRPNTNVGEVTEVDWVTAAAWLLRCSLLREVGYLDEGHKHFESDRHYCYAVRKAGWKVLYAPVTIVHHWRRSTPQAGWA